MHACHHKHAQLVCTFSQETQTTLNEITLFWGGIMGWIYQSGQHKDFFFLWMSEWLKEPQGVRERGREFVRQHLSVAWWWLFSSNLSEKLSASCFFECMQPFLSLKLKRMQWITTILEELSRNKRWLLTRGEEVRRRRNLKPHCLG